MLEKWKRAVDNKKVFGALVTSLLKAFDYISHDLQIANINGYGLSFSALKLIHDHVLNRKQKIKNKNLTTLERTSRRCPTRIYFRITFV